MTRFRDVATSPCVVMDFPEKDFTFRSVGADDP